MKDTTILIIDDEPNVRRLIGSVLEDEGYSVLLAEDGTSGLALVGSEKVDLMILDVWLPGTGGLEILGLVKERIPDLPVIMISGHATVDVAVRAVKKGAFDFLEKPLGSDRIITLVRNALEVGRLTRENKNLRRRLKQTDDFVGSSRAMDEVRRLIEQASRSEVPVFIQGENGTGKELVAREIHAKGDRAHKAFIAVNCAAIPDSLIESELFGYEKGAFTGAVTQKKGRFELAHEGTLFLDEIIDLSAAAQAKVLRALQDQRFERVGGLASISVDTRIIAASNKDPHKAMEAKEFREDLFYRLHVLPIHVPPLRERTEDIPALVEYFLREGAPANGREQIPVVDADAMNLLRDYSWPGNIRQLKNIVERVLVLSTEKEIGEDIVRFALDADGPQNSGTGQAAATGQGSQEGFADKNLNDARDEFEKTFILQKLEENEYNVSRTAQVLGLYPSNLHAKIKKFNIQWEK